MNGKEKTARELGQILRGDDGSSDLEERRFVQRQAVVEMAITGPERRRARRRRRAALCAAAAASAAAACAAFYLNLVPASEEQIPFFVGDSMVQEQEGRFLRTGPEERTVVRFDGGTQLEFSKSTEARVAKASGRSVTIDLEQGGVTANVNPASKRRWTVRAGPYEVVVKGTVFSVDWNDGQAVLSVSVDRGRVAVLGPGIAGEGVPVAAGSSLTAEANANRITFEQIGRDDASYADVSEADEAVESLLPEKSQAKAKTRTPLELCRRAYRDKDYGAVLSLAERHGVLAQKGSLRGDDLWMFANAARYARRNELSNQLFSLYRARFSKSSRAETAAFLLARSALSRRDDADARKWFAVYLSEAPRGPLAEEALGHMMGIYGRTGNTAQARRLARDYLSKYNGGYFTKQAQQVLTE